MMPEGVEHYAGGGDGADAWGVTDSMMPEGVEHMKVCTIWQGNLCDRFHDAGRR